MRLLVTGGAGFIGSAVVRAALADGWEVRVLDLAPRPEREEEADDGVVYFRGDVADAGVLDAALGGVGVVCHLAAKVGLEQGIGDAPSYASTNVLATAQLLPALVRHGIRGLVLASSMVVYGDGTYVHPATGRSVRPAPRREADFAEGLFEPRDPDDGAVLLPALTTEDAPTDPRSVYALSKLAQEHLVATWARAGGGTAVALRYHNVYGPGLPRNTPYAGVAALFASSVARGEAPHVFEDGQQRRSFVHVDDVAEATVLAARHAVGGEQGSAGRTAFRAFNVGGPAVQTILDVAEVLARGAGAAAPVVTGQFRAGDVRHITASSAAIAAELGWRPRIGFEEGMGALAAGLRRQGRADGPRAPSAMNAVTASTTAGSETVR
ncbi:NAD-dependent epimerase/dehydratase family protein [Sinomonas sp. ASV322]|uniref:NAD-dependent epimerase/dehydratase family protein n=1 Tax=Sinomonas sp. ASV322 TaxID=3041920 RepID=UPI0027DD3A55|nr:NAD-dependent epimerase/dehydratase family protein [Sinomonas sp. ASV322]MDQ4503521.1 NAD-dependent epimerase/dehydratase family protein [Sinomonas sp. ASV322]